MLKIYGYLIVKIMPTSNYMEITIKMISPLIWDIKKKQTNMAQRNYRPLNNLINNNNCLA